MSPEGTVPSFKPQLLHSQLGYSDFTVPTIWLTDSQMNDADNSRGQFPDGALLTFSISSCLRAEKKTLFGCVYRLDFGIGIDVGSRLIHEIPRASQRVHCEACSDGSQVGEVWEAQAQSLLRFYHHRRSRGRERRRWEARGHHLWESVMPECKVTCAEKLRVRLHLTHARHGNRSPRTISLISHKTALKAASAQVRLTFQLATYYSEPASQQQDETLNHFPQGFRVPVLNWPQTQP
ncbi:hypothetical protein P7K49_030815 [Saguinus oedipus]|uniref:Uncharacterized protein n=1 Tax=Saguinus oedipus TaxID=9490 RepID=A0ABQ9U391_SAGOE|nr:hypothetical protein P7K49_030815 [Saguinus oedipus]